MTDPIPLYMDRAQVKRYLGLGEVETENLFREVPVYKASERRVRVRREDAVEWMERHRQEAAA